MAGIFPPRTTTNVPPSYGSTDDGGHSVTTDSTVDTSASVTFTTNTTNTVWLVVVSAQVNTSIVPGAAASARGEVYVKVDGVSTDTDGVFEVHEVTSAGAWPSRVTITGRAVVTLATAASHTLLAQLFATGMTISYDTVTITVSQLTG